LAGYAFFGKETRRELAMRILGAGVGFVLVMILYYTDGLARLFHWTGIAGGVAPGYLLPVLCWGLGVLGVLCVLPWWIQAIEGFLPPADPRAALPASLLLGLLTGILATAAVMQDAPLSARGLLTAVFGLVALIAFGASAWRLARGEPIALETNWGGLGGGLGGWHLSPAAGLSVLALLASAAAIGAALIPVTPLTEAAATPARATLTGTPSVTLTGTATGVPAGAAPATAAGAPSGTSGALPAGTPTGTPVGSQPK
jgi:hypothetical protein